MTNMAWKISVSNSGAKICLFFDKKKFFAENFSSFLFVIQKKSTTFVD